MPVPTPHTPHTPGVAAKNDSDIVRYPLGGNCPLLRTTALGTALLRRLRSSLTEKHIMKNWGLPKLCEAAILEADLPASVGLSNDCSEGQYLDCILLRDSEPEPLNSPAPQFLTHRNCEIINLVEGTKLGVIYYLAIH